MADKTEYVLGDIVERLDAYYQSEEWKKFEQEAIIEGAKEMGLKKGKEEGLQIGLEQGIEQGIEQGKMAIAKKLLEHSMGVEEIANITELSKEVILQLQHDIRSEESQTGK